jgi:hypothetical protein
MGFVDGRVTGERDGQLLGVSAERKDKNGGGESVAETGDGHSSIVVHRADAVYPDLAGKLYG